MPDTLSLKIAMLFLQATSFFILTGCAKNNTEEQTTQATFTPVHGGPGNTLIISGNGFDPDKSKNRVSFSGVPANIVEATDTNLAVIVPDNISTGAITVVTNGRQLDFDVPFIVSSSNLVLGPLSAGDVLTVGLPSEFYVNGLRMDKYVGSASSFFEIVMAVGDDVYIGGEALAPNNTPSPTYWKNGVPTYIGNGSIEGKIRGMKIINGEVHAVGYTKLNGKRLASYWHDGIAETLPFGDEEAAEAWDIAFVNNNIHIVGFNGRVGKYVRNGALVSLPMSAKPSGFYSIAVDNNDVYIAGSGAASNGDLTKARYWKNDEPVTLTNEAAQEHAYNIAIDNGDIYVSGDRQTGNNLFMAKYWKNGVSVNLANIANSSRAIAIDASAGHCYMTGHENYAIRCWKDGLVVPFPYPELGGNGVDIFVVK